MWEFVVPALTGTLELVLYYSLWRSHYFGGAEQLVRRSLRRRIALPYVIAAVLHLLMVLGWWGAIELLVRESPLATGNLPWFLRLMVVALITSVSSAGAYAAMFRLCQKYSAIRLPEESYSMAHENIPRSRNPYIYFP